MIITRWNVWMLLGSFSHMYQRQLFAPSNALTAQSGDQSLQNQNLQFEKEQMSYEKSSVHWLLAVPLMAIDFLISIRKWTRYGVVLPLARLSLYYIDLIPVHLPCNGIRVARITGRGSF